MGTGGVSVVRPDGTLHSFIATGDDYTTNIAFGGPDHRTAFITLSRSGKLVKMDWHCRGPCQRGRLGAGDIILGARQARPSVLSNFVRVCNGVCTHMGPGHRCHYEERLRLPIAKWTDNPRIDPRIRAAWAPLVPVGQSVVDCARVAAWAGAP